MAKWVGYRHQTAQDQSKSKQTSSFVSSTSNYFHGLFVVFCFVLHFNLKFYRIEETFLSQIHIGHLYMTHFFFVIGEEPPFAFHAMSWFHVLLYC